MIRDVTQGIVPQRQRVNGAVPFNLMKSEQLVWVIQGVDYLEMVVRRGTSHGVSIRVARGLYHRPSAFRSRPIEWEETVHADSGLLGLTTKHVCFAGSRKRFRVRYDRIVIFDPYDDGFGIMRDAQTAKPQSFQTGDGRSACNIVTNHTHVRELISEHTNGWDVPPLSCVGAGPVIVPTTLPEKAMDESVTPALEIW